MNTKKLLVAALAAVALSGCYKTNLSGFGSEGGPGAEVKVYNHTLIAGLIPLGDVDINKACGDKGVWAVSTRMNLLTLLAQSFTFSIYSPQVAKITCKS